MARASRRMVAAIAASLAGIFTVVMPAGAQATVAGTGQPVATTYGAGTPGIASVVPHSVRPLGTGSSTRPKGARRVAPTAATTAPDATPAAVSAPSAIGQLSANFNGVSSRDSEFTNYNLEFEPPDQGLCEGNGFVLEAVNSAYRIYQTNGVSVRGPFNVNDLFNVGGKEFTSDPRCWFDPATRTWFATILFLNDTFTVGKLLIAVSQTPDPTGLWNEYQIDTTDVGGNGCPCFGDQPRIGIDQTNLYVTTDEFSIQGPQFNGAQLYAFSKADLVAGRGVHFVHFGPLRVGGTLPVAPQPALSVGTPNAEYMMGSLDLSGGGDNRIVVWAITNRGNVATGGSPLLSNVVIRSEPYAVPPPAAQRGSKSHLDSGDDRMQQVESVGASLWGELTTAVRIPGDGVRAAGAWFQVVPALNGTRIGGAAIFRQGYVAQAGEYVIYPAVQPDAAGNAAMVFTLTGRDRYPSAAYAVLSAGSANFGAPVVAAAGTGPYNPKATRWGDYSFAVPDPSADAAWMATEYVPPLSSQTTDGRRNWGTRVIQVQLH